MNGTIRCLGCENEFESIEAMHKFHARNPHPDVGETFLTDDSWRPGKEALDP